MKFKSPSHFDMNLGEKRSRLINLRSQITFWLIFVFLNCFFNFFAFWKGMTHDVLKSTFSNQKVGLEIHFYQFELYFQYFYEIGGERALCIRRRYYSPLMRSRGSYNAKASKNLSGLEPKLIKLEFIIYLPKLKVYSRPEIE